MRSLHTLDVARAVTPGDSWWESRRRPALLRMAATGVSRLLAVIAGR
ncbi:MAG: hypothetical protein ACFCVC_02125 [Acidimicrobiia bacterium]